MRQLLPIIALIFLGCRGEVVLPALPDAGDMGATGDLVEAPDLGRPDLGGPDPLCVGVTCLANAECGRGACWCSAGFLGDPNIGCTPGNPCQDVSCSFGSTCDDDGQCPCDSGFSDNGLGGCGADTDEFPLDRTEEEVCARWRADYPETAGVQWQVRPATTCEPGELDPAFQLDAVRRVSLFRWLVGLQAVTTSRSYMQLAQACATALDAENVGATHDVLSDFQCYTAAAADGARESSIVLGVATPAAAVDRFIADDGVTALGNRRWILNPEMGATAFGQRGAYSCMYAIDPSGSANPQYVAYPYGVFPMEALRGRWNWSSSQLVFNENTTVTITDAGGANLPVTNLTILAGNVVPAALAWEVTGASAPNEYTVTIQGLAGATTEVIYPVTLVSCP